MQDKRTKRLREGIDAGRALYKEVAPKLEDPERLLSLIEEIFGYLDPIFSIDSESTPYAAMFAIGQVQTGLKETEKHIRFYRDYQAKQEELQRLSNDESGPHQEHSADLRGTVAESVT